MKKIVVWFVLVLAAALPAAAGQRLLGILGGGNSINLPLILGGVVGDLTVTFESVTSLSLPHLGVSVLPVSPSDPALLARLPEGVSIPPGLPLLVRIEPPALGGLTFKGVATVEILPLSLLSPSGPSTRMYAAPTGGQFSDITTSSEPTLLGNTYRVIGTKGGFSEFLLIIDPTPLDEAVAAKMDRLDQILADNAAAIPGPVFGDLSADLAATRDHIAQGNTAAAIHDLDLFLATVQQHSGTDIPNVWRAQHDLTNVAGLLRAGAMTLQFSLRLEQGSGP